MCKLFTLIALFCVSSTQLLAQSYCGSLSPEEMIRANKGLDESQKTSYLKQLAKAEAQFKQTENAPRSKAASTFVIPVVFHILHNNGVENIGNAQILDQLRIMNEEFNRKNKSLSSVETVFKDRVADIQIEYRLATIDPNGNCTNGIIRYVDPRTNFTSSEDIDKVKPEYFWPTGSYLNCLVVGKIASSGGGRTLGFAQFPFDLPPFYIAKAETDGVVMVHDGIGGIGTSTARTSSVTTHEIGHWLGLFHTWGNCAAAGTVAACACDDEVSDTPNTQGNPSVCNLIANTCGEGEPNDEKDNVQNFMDYSFCYSMFTEGQKTRMHNVLNTIERRKSLWQPENLVKTGTVSANMPTAICQANFGYTQKEEYCEGSTVKFNDLSFHNVTSRKWTFEGGSPATSTDSAPTISYPKAGKYSVSLTVQNSTSSKSTTEVKIINVIKNNELGSQYYEDFENFVDNGKQLSFNNVDKDSIAFVVTNRAGFSGTKSLYLHNNANTSKNKYEEIISSTIDLSGYTNPQFTFKYAFAAKQSTDNEEFNVYVSTNCGATWFKRSSIKILNLKTAPDQNEDFTPSSKDQWKESSVNLANYIQNGLRIKFEFKSGGGNDFFLDDINISNVTAVNNNTAELAQFSVYPNPMAENASVVLGLNKTSKVTISLSDITGRKVRDVFTGSLPAGNQEVSIEKGNLIAGIYFIHLESNGQKQIKKLIIQ